jgi:hypothetical protein
VSCYSVAEEITLGRADFLVELRGFEPLTSADQPPVWGGGVASALIGWRRWLIEKIDLASVKLRNRYTVEEGP